MPIKDLTNRDKVTLCHHIQGKGVKAMAQAHLEMNADFDQAGLPQLKGEIPDKLKPYLSEERH